MTLKKVGTEKPAQDEVITADRVITGYELGAALGLLAVAVLIPSLAMIWRGRASTFAEFTSMILLWIYMFAVIATFSIIILWGFGRLVLPEKFMNWLGAATIGEIAGILLFVIKQIFAK